MNLHVRASSNPIFGPAPRSILFFLFVNYRFFKKLPESIKNIWQNCWLGGYTFTFFCYLAPFCDYFVPFFQPKYFLHVFYRWSKGTFNASTPRICTPYCGLHFMQSLFIKICPFSNREGSIPFWMVSCMLQKPQNPTFIDLIMRNKPKCFQNSITIETGCSDFKITITFRKIT